MYNTIWMYNIMMFKTVRKSEGAFVTKKFDLVKPILANKYEEKPNFF